MIRMMSVLVAVAIAIAVSAPALATGDLDPASAKMLKGYVLSMDKIKALQTAVIDFNKAAASDPSVSAGSGGNAMTIAQSEAQLKANPKAFAIFQRHGLNADDACMLLIVLINAQMAASSPDMAKSFADRTSPQQIAFYKQHQAEIANLKFTPGSPK